MLLVEVTPVAAPRATPVNQHLRTTHSIHPAAVAVEQLPVAAQAIVALLEAL
jgi:hypothetical protein